MTHPGKKTTYDSLSLAAWLKVSTWSS